MKTINKETAQTIWQKNLNLTRDLTGRVNKVLALYLTHGEIEQINNQLEDIKK